MNDPRILHQRFVEMGRHRNRLMHRMLAILPEIYESGIYKRYAATIEEYAGRFGGISENVVRKRLNLEKSLENKPFLREAIKDVGIHKVYAVANITTPETDAAMADKLKHMSKLAIVSFAKEMRKKQNRIKKKEIKIDKNQIGIGEDTVDNYRTTFCAAVPEEITIKMDAEMTFLFLKLKQKLGKNIGNRDLMKNLLLRLVDEEFPQPRPGTSLANNKKDGQIEIGAIQRSAGVPAGLADSRHVRVAKKRQELAKTGGRCAYPGCNRPPENWHHRDRFSESHSHESVIPLCKVHHEFMHNGLVKNELENPKNWLMDLKNTVTNPIDFLYRKHRREALT